MRTMEIPPFPRQVEIPDVNELLRSRLSQRVVMWPEQAIPLLGYMCWPNDQEARTDLILALRTWGEETEGHPRPTISRKLPRIQHQWLRVADLFHLHFDLMEGQHQARRGGPSIGKAVTLAQANLKSPGTRKSPLWRNWAIYKDVAPVVTAAVLVCAEARARYDEKAFGRCGLGYHELIPFQIGMLAPDLVLAVGLEFQRVGLAAVPRNAREPSLDHQTLWHIPADINVAPCPPPTRKIRAQDMTVLNDRRAGNRGRRNIPKALRT